MYYPVSAAAVEGTPMARSRLVLPELVLRIHSPNRNEIANQISVSPDIVFSLPPTIRFVFMCFTNRAGSAFFGDLLQSTGVFGQAFESLNGGSVLSYCCEHHVRSIHEYFARIVGRDVRNGIYIVKAAPEQLRMLTEAGILDQISARSEFLFISRADKLAQAISRAIAEQNNRWAWDTPSDFPDANLVYSAERITQHLYDIVILEQCFVEFFALNGITPINVEYERLENEPQQELEWVADRLGLPPMISNTSKLRFQRQANEVNKSWIAFPFGDHAATWHEVGGLQSAHR
jgi:LPS sulfotransferase NodH